MADSSGQVLENDYGEDVRKGASEASETVANLGGIAVAGVGVGSGGAIAGGVVSGARESRGNKEGQKTLGKISKGSREGGRDHEDRSEDTAGLAKEKDESGQWVDLPV